MVLTNPMFHPPLPKPSALAAPCFAPAANEVCKVCRDLAAKEAAAIAEAESRSLQLQLLDFESDVLFEISELQNELLDVRSGAEELQRELEESEKKRLKEQHMKLQVEQQLLQLSDEILQQKLRAAAADELSAAGCDSEGFDQWQKNSSRTGSAEQPVTPDLQEMKRTIFSPVGTSSIADESCRIMDASAKDNIALKAELAQLCKEHRALRQELIETKLELANSRAASLRAERSKQVISAESAAEVSHGKASWPKKWNLEARRSFQASMVVSA